MTVDRRQAMPSPPRTVLRRSSTAGSICAAFPPHASPTTLPAPCAPMLQRPRNPERTKSPESRPLRSVPAIPARQKSAAPNRPAHPRGPARRAVGALHAPRRPRRSTRRPVPSSPSAALRLLSRPSFLLGLTEQDAADGRRQQFLRLDPTNQTAAVLGNRSQVGRGLAGNTRLDEAPGITTHDLRRPFGDQSEQILLITHQNQARADMRQRRPAKRQLAKIDHGHRLAAIADKTRN